MILLFLTFQYRNRQYLIVWPLPGRPRRPPSTNPRPAALRPPQPYWVARTVAGAASGGDEK